MRINFKRSAKGCYYNVLFKMKSILLFSFLLFYCPLQVIAIETIKIQDTPMDTMAKAALPNIMFILDDSGSMDWEFMISGETNGLYSGKYYIYPDSSYVDNNNDRAYGDSSLTATQRRKWKTRWSGHNLIFYNPNATYAPWPTMDAASTNEPWSNPDETDDDDSKLDLASDYVTASGVDIKTANYFIIDDLNGDGLHDNGEDIYLVNFIAGVRQYYLFNDANNDNDIDAGELTLKTYAQTPDGVKAAIYDDDNNFLKYTTDTEDLQNFANWFSYYHKRELIAKAAIGQSIVQMETGNVGLYSVHKRVKKTVVQIPANQSELLTALYGLDSSGGTPLRKALEDVGQYYDQDDNNTGNLGDSPYASANEGGICQQAFAIAMTDGFWNGDSPNVGDADDNDSSAWDGGPFAHGASNTLADVAMKYFEEDLADNLDNKLPTTPCEQIDENTKANHQHMITYTVSFGQKTSNELNPDNYMDCLAHEDEDNYPEWTTPSGNNSTKIDDLYHAAVNGRGLFFSASNAQELVESLTELTSDIAGRTASGSSVAVNSEELQTGSMIYQASFESENWTGGIKAYPISPTTGIISSTPEWNAAEKLEEPGFEWNERNIITYHPDEKKGVDFQWGDLAASQKTILNSDENILKYIRGKMDIADFRSRSQKLGDIVHSAPTLKNTTLFAGGNDGMLHAFDIETGEERFAYVPNLIMGNFYDVLHAKNFTSPSYEHQFFVDGTAMIQDNVDPADELAEGDDDDKKYTYLVGGFGKGGKGYYCLNITDADSMTKDSDIADIEKMVLWEYPDMSTPAAEIANLGFSFSRASIVRTNLSTDEGPADDKKKKWVVIFGNGYNSVSGNSVLYVLGLDGSLLKMIDTGVPGGLSTPNVVDVNNDMRADYVYAGDLSGNLWKFNVSSSDIADWDVAYNDGSNTAPNYGRVPLFEIPGRAITTQPDIMRACETDYSDLDDCPIEDNSGGYMIYFGTGQYFHKDDMTTQDEQYVFGVWDYGDDSDKKEYLGEFNPLNGKVTNTAKSRTYNLLEQKIDHSGVYFGQTIRIMTDYEMDLLTACDDAGDLDSGTWENPDPTSSSHAGWFFKLSNSNSSDYTGDEAGYPNPGERSIKDVFVRDGKLIYLTFTPNDAPCSGGGKSMLHEVDACTGGRLDHAQLDLNDDQMINAQDYINLGTEEDPVMVPPSGWVLDGLVHNPAIIGKPGGTTELKIFSSTAGNMQAIEENTKKMGIYYWYEN